MNLNVAALALEHDASLVAKERRRKSDGAVRGVLYFVNPHSKSERVEFLGTYRSLQRAQAKGEALVVDGLFKVASASTQSNHQHDETTNVEDGVLRHLRNLIKQYYKDRRVVSLHDVNLVSYPSLDASTSGSLLKAPALHSPFLQLYHSPSSTFGIFDYEPPPCPTPKSWQKIDVITGEITLIPKWQTMPNGEKRVIRCESNDCDSCVVINARRVAYAIALAEPTHSLTITQPGTESAVIKKKLKVFIFAVREKWPDFHMVWAAEESEDGMVHVHALYYIGNTRRGLSAAVIECAKARAGLSTRCQSRPIPRGAGSGYMGYMLKTLTSKETASRFHQLNRMSTTRLQLVHGRGFWRDGAGGPMLTRKAAETLSYQRSRARAPVPC